MNPFCILCKYFKCCPPMRDADDFLFRFALNPQFYVEGNKMRMTTEQQVSATVVPKTATGKPAKIDGEVTFASSDPAVAVVTKTGPMSADVVAKGEGVCQITADFDADLGAGVRDLTFSAAVEVVAPEAVTAEIDFTDPVAQP